MDIDLEFEPSTGELEEKLRELAEDVEAAIDEAATDIALQIVQDAQRNAPVDTGQLRASITFETETRVGFEATVKVGSNVKYAIFQEIDNPWLRPAIEENRDFIIDRLEEAVIEAVDEVE